MVQKKKTEKRNPYRNGIGKFIPCCVFILCCVFRLKITLISFQSSIELFYIFFVCCCFGFITIVLCAPFAMDGCLYVCMLCSISTKEAEEHCYCYPMLTEHKKRMKKR